VLGWSPTLRALLQLKRKSRPEIDENEDGARASIIEEGISTWIFNHGARNADFRAVKTLDYGLFRGPAMPGMICGMGRGLAQPF
jgi:hypothetical protein